MPATALDLEGQAEGSLAAESRPRSQNEDTADDESEDTDSDAAEDEDDDDDDEAEEDEPKLKYARMTSNLGAVYRNGDATSAFLVAGDKMVSFIDPRRSTL